MVILRINIYLIIIVTHYEKKFEMVMVNNSTDINKPYKHLSPQLIQHKKSMRHDVGNPTIYIYIYIQGWILRGGCAG